MAVLKLGSSGRSLQFINDDGIVFQLSMSLFQRVVSGDINGNFVVLTQLPTPNLNVFPPSPVYDDSGVAKAVLAKGNNAGSKEFLQERKEQRAGKRASEFKVVW